MRRALILAVSLLSAFAAAKEPQKPAAKREFSAEMVMVPKEGTPTRMKAFFGNSKVRMEMDAGGQPMVMLADYSGKDAKSFMLMPSQKMAMDLSGPMAQAMGGAGVADPRAFATSDAKDPCGDVKDGSRTCKKIGTETIDGRKTTHWTISEKGEKTMDAWIDEELGLMVRGVMASGDQMKLENVVFASQPASLFEVPSDYTLMPSPSGMPLDGPPQKQPNKKKQK